jgi:carboxylate-amine ligase
LATLSNPPPDAPRERPLALFEGCRLAVQYMLVDGESLDAASAADELLETVPAELESGDIGLRHGLALHVVELGCKAPRRTLEGVTDAFAATVRLANGRLGRDGLRLMPTAMHPWLDPSQAALWPHGTERLVYETLDRIFSCRSHGWANQQCLKIELPFASDEEFARLHAAARFLLPILPGLAASSPVVGGERNGRSDNRLVAYRGKCARVPSVIGATVPEPVGSIGEYHERVLEPIYRDLTPHDPEGVLRHERINARGAIACFDPLGVQIRVLDVQEAPAMDVAYTALIVELLKLLCAERWLDAAGMNRWRTERLATLLDLAARQGEGAGVAEKSYLRALGYRGSATELKGLWEHLIETVSARGSLDAGAGRLLEHYLRHGTLATRIGKAVGLVPTRAALHKVYEQLCEALADGTPFAPPAPRRP